MTPTQQSARQASRLLGETDYKAMWPAEWSTVLLMVASLNIATGDIEEADSAAQLACRHTGGIVEFIGEHRLNFSEEIKHLPKLLEKSDDAMRGAEFGVALVVAWRNLIGEPLKGTLVKPFRNCTLLLDLCASTCATAIEAHQAFTLS